MSQVPLFSKTWDEGRVWDLWMIVHFLLGVSGGLSNVFLKLSTQNLWLLAIALMIVWEIIEYANGVREQIENRVIDLFIGLAGVYAATSFASTAATPTEQSAFVVSTILVAAACFLGWRAYKKRVAEA